MKPLTGSLNTTVKSMGADDVGSGWLAAWLSVTVGLMVSTTRVLLADAGPMLPATSVVLALMA